MTNLDALTANLASPHGIVLDSSSFLKVLIDNDVNPDLEYSKANVQVIDICTVALYNMILATSNLTEGNLNYSISQKEFIKNTVDSLLIKWGLPQQFSTVSSISSVSPW